MSDDLAETIIAESLRLSLGSDSQLGPYVPFYALASADAAQGLAVFGQREGRGEERARVDRARTNKLDRRSEAAQDRHRAGHGDLVVVDAERREAHRRLGR